MKIHFVPYLLCVLALDACGAWSPPTDPDPTRILAEARADREAGRYEVALAKHVWYHENALKLKRSQAGVRLSFALLDWVALAEKHPPALEKLKSVREMAEKSVRDGKDERRSFLEFDAINVFLREPARTKDLFVWLDANKPEVARRTYNIAQKALVRAKEYRLCGRYLEADMMFEQMKERFALEATVESDAGISSSQRGQSTEWFANEASTLVALLVVNDRKDEAEKVAAQALKELDTPSFRRALESAKKGVVPEPSP